MKRNNLCPVDKCCFFSGALEGTRTPDLLVRSQSLYPAELPAHVYEIVEDLLVRSQSLYPAELLAHMREPAANPANTPPSALAGRIAYLSDSLEIIAQPKTIVNP